MPFTLPDLPFAKDALGTFMSAETFDYHHGKHHKAYVDKLNGFVADKGLEGSLDGHHSQSQGRRRQGRLQQCRAALEPQLLLAMPRPARGAEAGGQARRR